jgi:uncharacterized membrane protein
MDMQTIFVYCFLTMIVTYIILYLDNLYISKNQYNDSIFRISLLSGLINWLIIVYFIIKTEDLVPELKLRNYEIIGGSLC